MSWERIVGSGAVRVMKPGVLRKLTPAPERTARDSVLFWRNADYNNGAGIAIASVRMLAPRYLAIRFVFAVLPGGEFQRSISLLERELPNVALHVFPYADDVSLESLLGEALLVIAPFRRLSTSSQVSILETLVAGDPVITTDTDSNKEVVMHARTGILVEVGKNFALSQAVECLLDDRKKLEAMASNTVALTNKLYNWAGFTSSLKSIYGPSYG